MQGKTSQYSSLIGAISYLVIGFGIAISLLQYFVLTLPKPAPVIGKADGIVVATGGQARLRAGLALLRDGKAPVMLISGVGSGISKEMIAQSFALTTEDQTLLDCCVKLEFEANDTFGNAMAARQWAKGQNINRIILVTSHYHMPRAALEFRQAMPEHDIIAFPIIAPSLIDQPWYHSWDSLRLYAREFLKYHYRKAGLILGLPQ